MGTVLCPPVAVVAVKDTFTGECCFVHPQGIFNKTGIMFMFLPVKHICIQKVMCWVPLHIFPVSSFSSYLTHQASSTYCDINSGCTPFDSPSFLMVMSCTIAQHTLCVAEVLVASDHGIDSVQIFIFSH
jgi:hypothetical protein